MRKLIAITICLILLVSCPLSAAAATRDFLMQDYDVTDDAVYCYGMQLPEDGTLTVSAGSRTLKDVTLSTLEEENIPVTLYCLVDTATSLSDEACELRDSILLSFSNLMSGNDNMVLATVDDSLTAGQPLAGKAKREDAIAGISGDSWKTTLYDGMSQALDALHTSTSYNTNRCLVVLSDGTDDGSTSATSDTVLKKIEETGIPVYTVILTTGNFTAGSRNAQTSFAENSLGGSMIIPSEDKTTGVATATQIWDSIKSGSVIRIGAEDFQDAQGDQELLIRYNTEERRYEDTILIREVDLPSAGPEATDPNGEGEEDGFPWIFVIIGAAVLVLAGIVIAVVLVRKKKQATEAGQAEDIAPQDDAIVSGDESPDGLWDMEPNQNEMTMDDLSQTAPVANRCHVTAVAIMHPDVQADFYLTEKVETSFGRKDTADIILNPNDKKLSGCHGCFFWDGENLFVSDRNSTNGTAVNGEVCREKVWLRVEEGSVLTAGNYEYRINFRADNQI